MTATSGSAIGTLDEAAHRQLAKDLYNHAWSLLEKPEREPAEDDELANAAHASAFHWSKGGGTLANAARAEWLIARAYSTLGRGEPARWHARRCLEIAEAAVAAGVADHWDVPAALEGLARAEAVAGELTAARATHARAVAALDRIADPEDREQIEQELATIPI